MGETYKANYLSLNNGSNERKCGERRERRKGVRGVKRWTEGSELE